MAKGSVTLGEVATRASHIEVACTRCERRGRYRLARLVASYGEDFPMTDLGAEIADCPKRHAAITERCDVYFPGLRKIMDPNGETPRSPAQDHGDDDDE
ncbi:hypothetical protein LMG29542_03406 [Paraburkholderia humisilvae]|uniref:Uncharacterized protein n=1 Tax=Paraburkholderia humisilvae TaxID=627669 RepID=A0A6J5E0L0_9BURK|nr:hypothetical protein LMG29542_03406 [Paraburkholderia humisilvae]